MYRRGILSISFIYYIDEDNSLLYIYGKDNYAFLDAQITEFYISSISQPIGYPLTFTHYLTDAEVPFTKNGTATVRMQLYGGLLYQRLSVNIINITGGGVDSLNIIVPMATVLDTVSYNQLFDNSNDNMCKANFWQYSTEYYETEMVIAMGSIEADKIGANGNFSSTQTLFSICRGL